MLPAESFRVHKRGYRIGKCKPCEAAYQREFYANGGEKTRERKRRHMAKLRAEQPERLRATQREWTEANRDRINAKVREETARRIFWARALRLRNGITAKMLASLWGQQRGLCALSGQKLGRDAEIDHKLPRARGGADHIGNLQWVTPLANRAKRDLTDAEFLALCQACARWIGERIAAVESITKMKEAA
jgi:5-methylcytosine-specific restriction endonuclease McrA